MKSVANQGRTLHISVDAAVSCQLGGWWSPLAECAKGKKEEEGEKKNEEKGEEKREKGTIPVNKLARGYPYRH